MTAITMNMSKNSEDPQTGPTARVGTPAGSLPGEAGRDIQRLPVWTDAVRSYLRQQIADATSAEERADAVRLAKTLARG